MINQLTFLIVSNKYLHTYIPERAYVENIKFQFCLLSFQIEAGDVILKVNGTDVHRYSTKEGKYLTTHSKKVVDLSHSIYSQY